ncbi:tRNA pseudouridine(55) synthase TruB [bacterium]|nr:tRNA pseudouridine(55) synthase TruB [bacterium]
MLPGEGGNGNLEKVININKPAGWTSFDVVRRVKHYWPQERVGHAGTLDPFAEGVLLICVGKATKQVPALMAQPKEYRATVQLGIETDTLDITGRIVAERSVPNTAVDDIRAVLPNFVGCIQQVPPRYSALKQDGQRLYDLARRGAAVEPQERSVNVHELELSAVKSFDLVELRIVCSKGTFIRSLARDVAHALGTVGFVRRLIRTRIGVYQLEQAADIDRPATWQPGECKQ